MPLSKKRDFATKIAQSSGLIAPNLQKHPCTINHETISLSIEYEVKALMGSK